MSLSKLETDTAAAIKRAYPNTSDSDALRTAIELVGTGAVYKDMHGVVRHSPAASLRCPAVFAPPASGDSDAEKVARASARAALIRGTMPGAPEASPFPADPRIANATRRAAELRARGFGGGES